jgi:hypothetical protein
VLVETYRWKEALGWNGPEAGNKIFGENIEICAGCLTLNNPRSGTDVVYVLFSALAARPRKSTRDEPH